MIAHRDQVYPGQHPAIIDQATWDAVQARLHDNKQGEQRREGAAALSLLAGRIFDGEGRRLTPSHAQKEPKRYRYYVSQHLTQDGVAGDGNGLRIPAGEVERVVGEHLQQVLRVEALLFLLLDLGNASPEQARASLIKAGTIARQMQSGTDQQRSALGQAMLQRLSVNVTSIELVIAPAGLRTLRGMPSMPQEPEANHTFTIPMRLRRCGGVSRLVISDERAVQAAAEPDKVLLRAVAKAFAWHQQLVTDVGATPASIADAEGITMPYLARVLHLAALAPDIVEAIIEGRQPVELSLDGIMDLMPLPLAWSAQRLALGFA